MHRHLALASAALLPLLAAAALEGQTADLRYVAPLPASVTFTSTDTVTNTISGLPTGSLTTSGGMRSVNHVRFVTSDSGLSVVVRLLEVNGSMSSPMGEVPITAGASDTMQVMIGDKGPDEASLVAAMGTQPSGGTPESQFGPGRALAVLINVPGRVLRAGETWTDTLDISTEVQEMEMKGTAIQRGTYTGDTIVDGRTLNVLRIETEMNATTTGSAEGMQMSQDLKSVGTARILWDSARHIPLHSDVTADVTANMQMPAAAMAFDMQLRTRSITVAAPES